MPLLRGHEAHRKVTLGYGDTKAVACDTEGRVGDGSMNNDREGVGRRADGEREDEHGLRSASMETEGASTKVVAII